MYCNSLWTLPQTGSLQLHIFSKRIQFTQNTHSFSDSLTPSERKFIQRPRKLKFVASILVKWQISNWSPVTPVFFYVLKPERWKSVQCNWNCFCPWMGKKCCFVCVLVCVYIHMNENLHFLMGLCQSAGLCKLLSCSMNKAAFSASSLDGSQK